MKCAADMEKIHRHLSCKLIVCLTALVSLVLINNSISLTYNTGERHNMERVEAALKEDVPDGSKLLGLNNMGLLEAAVSDGSIAYSSSVGAFVRTGDAVLAVNAYLTNENYIDFTRGKLVKGSFFSREACIEGRNVAVIGEGLAKRLFNTYDVIGNQITLFDEKYKIVGLYRRERSLISLLGQDGSEEVFVPYQSHTLAGEMPVQRLYISDGSFSEVGFRVPFTEELLMKKAGVAAANYRISDFYDKGALVSQIDKIIIFVIGIWCIYILCANSVKFIKVYIKRHISDLENMYAPELLKSKGRSIALLLVFFAVLAGFLVWIFLSIRFKAVIPSEYVPQYNIFDMQFYFGKIKEAVNAANSSYGLKPSELDFYYKNTLILKSVVSILFVFSGLSFLSTAKLTEYSGLKGQSLWKALAISIPAAFFVSIVFSLVSGIGFAVPANILVLCCFLILKLPLLKMEKLMSPRDLQELA